MTLAVIARIDRGGLAAQTQQMARLLQPSKVLAVSLGTKSRGPDADPDTLDFGDAQVCHVTFGAQDPEGQRKAVRFLRDAQVCYSAEALYWGALDRQCRRTTFHVHANPEINTKAWGQNVVPALPSSWHASMFPRWPVVPHPTPWDEPAFVALRAENVERGGRAFTVLHVAAPAMLDRNGTDALKDGLACYDGPPFTLRVAGSGLDTPTRGRPNTDLGLPTQTGKRGQVDVQRVAEVADRADLYRGADLLVIPRRYGGQCLTATEAAAAGVPVLMSNVDPQDQWTGVDSSVKVRRGSVARMQGGRFRVADPVAESVAERLACFTSDDGTHRGRWQQEALGWAGGLAWPAVRDQWESWFGRDLP